jgi:hypothetical protein
LNFSPQIRHRCVKSSSAAADPAAEGEKSHLEHERKRATRGRGHW